MEADNVNDEGMMEDIQLQLRPQQIRRLERGVISKDACACVRGLRLAGGCLVTW